MAKVIERPAPKTVLKHCRDIGVDLKTLSSCLAVNPKTVERWQEGSAEPNEAAWRNLEKLETLCQLSFRLLRESSLKPWFNAPNESLGGEKPMETLGRGEIDRVKNVLGMLEWGIYS